MSLLEDVPVSSGVVEQLAPVGLVLFLALAWINAPQLLFAAVVVVVVVLEGAAIEGEDGTDDDVELEEARAAYVDGEISLEEFERRAELALDERAGRIREVVEEVGGVGPATSANLALAFDTVADLEAADREELEAVHGVGPSTAEALLDRLDDGVEPEVVPVDELLDDEEREAITAGNGVPWE